MSKRVVGIAVVTLVLIGSAVIVAILWPPPPPPPPPGGPPSAYVTYADDVTGEKFLVPKSTKVFSPIVNPKTGGRTLVRAHVLKPKDGGAPRAFWYEKFTDDQIKAMEAYVKAANPQDLEDMPPDAWLGSENDGPMTRAEGSKWTTFQDRARGLGGIDEALKDARKVFEWTPDDWGEKLTEDQVKQW